MFTQNQIDEYLKRIEYCTPLTPKVQLRKRLTDPTEIRDILKRYFGIENLSYIPLR